MSSNTCWSRSRTRSTIPIAGSAYTYAYATLGELAAWIIGWDLMLEYAVGNVAVAISWGDYFTTLLRGFGVDLPAWLTTGYRTAALSSNPAVHGLIDNALPAAVNLPDYVTAGNRNAARRRRGNPQSRPAEPGQDSRTHVPGEHHSSDGRR